MSKPPLVIGAPGSPYTLKMVALMRYRRIQYRLVWGNPNQPPPGYPRPSVALLPTFYFEDEDGKVHAEVDSTPIIRKFEQQIQRRTVLPPDPALNFVNYLLEDFADEWCTKCMFHYRWSFPSDIDAAGSLIPLWMDSSLAPDTLAQFKQAFAERQIQRLQVVGSSSGTANVIEESYRRLLVVLDTLLQERPFLLGNRPASADFALYGQLTQLARVDPTPTAQAMSLSPRTCAWVDRLGDLSGLEPAGTDWISLADSGQTLAGLLAEVGRVYLPVLLANAAAMAAGDKRWQTEVDGQSWQQDTFAYHGKCLSWIRHEYELLTGADKVLVDGLLASTGCLAMVAGSG